MESTRSGERRLVMLEATGPVLLLDYFRVPYDRRPPAERRATQGSSRLGDTVRVGGRRGSLTWLRASNGATGAYASGPYRLGTTPIFGKVLPDAASRAFLSNLGEAWERIAPVFTHDGQHVASVWRDRQGNIFLPFDPDELIYNLWSERYRAFAQTRTRSTFEGVVKPLYYRARAVVPTSVRLRLRRTYGRVASPAFPRWPTETALHDLYIFLFRALDEFVDESLPIISLWPRGRSWSFVLTHDVERSTGYEALERLRAVERETGYVSSWNFVPLRDYRVEQTVLDRLRSDGCEIGVHGLHHDGRDLDRRHLPRRLPRIRQVAEAWDAVGFRSPSLLRDFDVMPSLGFEYDSSYPDTDPLQAQAGGCCSWLPFFNDELVELPITLAQDHNVFELLRETDERLWREKATFLRARGGLALLLTHPDYMLESERLAAYERLLAGFAGDQTAWRPLPRDVSDWWRRRARSSVVRRNGRWEVEGPAAADASVASCSDVFVESADAAAAAS